MRRVWLGSLLVAGLAAWAQNAPDSNQPADPDAASHAVARLSLMNGGVSVAHGNAGELAGAAINAPLVTSDRVLTGANARAEVQFDAANLARLAPSTEVRMGELEYKRYQVQIAQGLVTFRVLRDNDAQVEISTPTVSVHPLRQGTYRVSVSPDGLTEITVRSGEAEVASPTGTEALHAGQSMMSRGSPSDPEFRTAAAPPPDDWDRWNADRDRVFENYGAAARNMPPDVYGGEDLGQYGYWTYDPAYGNVWVPYQDPDWAPYRDGRWSYVDYYGWSWVPYEPWGWAPYHYGRWYRGSFGWGWYPGAFGPRQYWSPALVGFFGWGAPGFGASFGFGFGFANVGWVPLAPFEAFHPWYGRGFGGFNNAVIVNNTNVTNVYRNARFTGSVTSVRAGDFGRSAVGRTNFVRASAGDLSRAGTMSGGVPFSPSRESRGFSATGAPANVQGLPRMNENARFFSAPARSPRASSGGFNPGRTAPTTQSAPRSFANSSPASTGASAAGWRRFDPSTSGSNTLQRSPGAAAQRNAPGENKGENRNFPGGNAFQGGNAARNASAVESNSPRQVQSGAGPQPVRIRPPIVNNRSDSFGAPRTSGSSGGFGGPRPSSGGAGGGGFRGAPSGGHTSGGGNRGGGGGNRGGGGGRR